MSKLIFGTAHICYENYNRSLESKSNLRLFKINLPTYFNLVPSLVNHLNADELARAHKYYFKKDANRFIICRTLLKFILARHIGLKVSEIRIKEDENKKPYLCSYSSLNFNLSHAKDYALIAIGESFVGVDIEYLNKDFDFTEILRTSFNSQEMETILSANNKVETFFKFWTRKEAVVKATGKGINDSFKEIPSKDGYHIVNPQLLGNSIDLQVFSFILNSKYIAALAHSGEEMYSKEIPCYSIPAKIEEIV